MDKTIIKIQMLGGFSIVSDGIRVVEHAKRSSKIWKLLQYLIVHRHRTVSQEELLDVFWPDNGRNNPGNALRTSIHRIRAALAEGGFPNTEDVILYNNGGYAWNNDMDCFVDTEAFEDLCQRVVSNRTEPEEKLRLLFEATDLYRGDFLPNAAGELWAMQILSYYRSLYIRCAHIVLELMTQAERYDEVEILCAKALRVDQLDEKIHEYHLRALLSQRKYAEAIAEYKRMETLFYDELGMAPEESLRNLYKHIHRTEAAESHVPDEIINEWLLEADFSGAYYCDYEMFKTVCKIEALSAARSGKSIFVIRLDVKKRQGKTAGSVMKSFGDAISNNLRKGDMFTRSGPYQYMLMLQNLTYENCKTLLERIINSLGAKHRPGDISTTIQLIEPLS